MIVWRCQVRLYDGCIKTSNQVHSISDGSLKMYTVWRCQRDIQHPFCWQVPAVSFELLGAIALIVDSKVRVYRSTWRQQLVMYDAFPIPSNAQHNISRHQCRLCHRLRSFSSLWPRSFSHIVVVGYPLFIVRY